MSSLTAGRPDGSTRKALWRLRSATIMAGLFALLSIARAAPLDHQLPGRMRRHDTDNQHAHGGQWGSPAGADLADLAAGCTDAPDCPVIVSSISSDTLNVMCSSSNFLVHLSTGVDVAFSEVCQASCGISPCDSHEAADKNDKADEYYYYYYYYYYYDDEDADGGGDGGGGGGGGAGEAVGGPAAMLPQQDVRKPTGGLQEVASNPASETEAAKTPQYFKSGQVVKSSKNGKTPNAAANAAKTKKDRRGQERDRTR